MQIPDYYPPILADIAHLLRLRLNAHFSEHQADELALAQVEDFSQVFGGCQIYIPKQDILKRHQRDQTLRREFTGHNHLELARRYALTVTQIYAILDRTRATRASATKGSTGTD